MRKRALLLSLSGLFFALSPLFAFTAAADACPFTWNANLKIGSKGADVLTLQQFLSVSPASGYYGALTSAAVSKFQEQYASDILTPNNLAKGTGMVGASTRAKLNALCTGVVVGTATISLAPATSDILTVTQSPTQPAHTIAPTNALYVPFTSVTFTAGSKDVTVSGVTLERSGAGSDSAFYDLGFLDPDGVEFSFGYLNGKHQVNLHDPFTVPAGTSQTYTIAGDMNFDLSGNDGEMPTLELDAVQTDTPVAASFPIKGTAQTVNSSLAIGSATTVLSPDDPRGDQTRYITDTGVRFAGIRITAGSAEDVRLTYVNWEQTGSAAPTDITNVVTVVNGVSYPATTNDGRYYYSDLGQGVVIKKGDSVDILAKGDLTGSGSNRTVKFDLYYSVDIGLVGQTYGFGIAPIPGGNTDVSGNDVFLTSDGGTDGTSLAPYFSGSLTNISAGAVSGVSKI